jgi:urease alpha subunit
VLQHVLHLPIITINVLVALQRAALLIQVERHLDMIIVVHHLSTHGALDVQVVQRLVHVDVLVAHMF